MLHAMRCKETKSEKCQEFRGTQNMRTTGMQKHRNNHKTFVIANAYKTSSKVVGESGEQSSHACWLT